ncbi:MAG: hypothetical protein HUK22_06410 [Thermoguttaceae bacterium]|nr:hypothetical protein [Thermoguttaceae bacterium]
MWNSMQGKHIVFFNDAVNQKIGAATARNLSKFGAYVRQTAKQSIRYRKTSSKPGLPPSSHVGTLKRLIFFGLNENRSSVLIGPHAVAEAIAPRVLEFGGNSFVKGRVAPKFGLGQYGPIRAVGPKTFVRAMLVTKPQVDRADKLAQSKQRSARQFYVHKRPYMYPALMKNLPKASGIWRNSVR